MKKLSIPAFQHRLLQRISVFAFKILNFITSPPILHEQILNNFSELSNFEVNPLYVPTTVKCIRTRVINIFQLSELSKYQMATISHFTHKSINCFKLKIFNKTLNKFLAYYFENIGIIFTAITNSFAKFNLEFKLFSWIKTC